MEFLRVGSGLAWRCLAGRASARVADRSEWAAGCRGHPHPLVGAWAVSRETGIWLRLSQSITTDSRLMIASSSGLVAAALRSLRISSRNGSAVTAEVPLLVGSRDMRQSALLKS